MEDMEKSVQEIMTEVATDTSKELTTTKTVGTGKLVGCVVGICAGSITTWELAIKPVCKWAYRKVKKVLKKKPIKTEGKVEDAKDNDSGDVKSDEENKE